MNYPETERLQAIFHVFARGGKVYNSAILEGFFKINQEKAVVTIDIDHELVTTNHELKK